MDTSLNKDNLSDISFDNDVLFELSMIDLIILKQIRSYQKPTLRFAIFEDINRQLPADKQLTSTKFYYALDRLEKLQLIHTQKGEKKRSILINKSDELDEVLSSLLRALLVSNYNYVALFQAMLSKIQEELNISLPIQTMLVDIPEHEKVIEASKLEILGNLCNQLYVLVTEDQFTYLVKRNPDLAHKFQLSKMLHNKIREPNDMFDVVLLLEFNIANMQSPSQFIKELLRITKSEGVILFAAFSHINAQNHFMLTPVLQQIYKLPHYHPIHQNKLLQLLTLANMPCGVIEKDGVLVGWIKV